MKKLKQYLRLYSKELWKSEDTGVRSVRNKTPSHRVGGGKSHKKKWETLTHNGVCFPKPYIPQNIPLLNQKKESIIIPPLAEEMAYHFAKLQVSAEKSK